MSGAWTPGAWSVNTTRYNRDFRTCVNVMTEDGLRFIAAVSCDPHEDSAQLYANARLIAAAPDLYAALWDAMDVLVAQFAQVSNPDDRDGWSDEDAFGVYCKARKALSSASPTIEGVGRG